MEYNHIRKPGRIGIFAVAHAKYWEQFDGLRDRLMDYHGDLCE